MVGRWVLAAPLLLALTGCDLQRLRLARECQNDGFERGTLAFNACLQNSIDRENAGWAAMGPIYSYGYPRQAVAPTPQSTETTCRLMPNGLYSQTLCTTIPQ